MQQTVLMEVEFLKALAEEEEIYRSIATLLTPQVYNKPSWRSNLTTIIGIVYH